LKIGTDFCAFTISISRSSSVSATGSRRRRSIGFPKRPAPATRVGRGCWRNRSTRISHGSPGFAPEKGRYRDQTGPGRTPAAPDSAVRPYRDCVAGRGVGAGHYCRASQSKSKKIVVTSTAENSNLKRLQITLSRNILVNGDETMSSRDCGACYSSCSKRFQQSHWPNR
jgi:hypothetical protein